MEEAREPTPWLGLMAALGLGFWAAALAVDGLPAIGNRIASLASLAADSGPIPRLMEHFDSPDQDRPGEQPQQLLAEAVLERLAKADERWLPRTELMPDGRTRYVYRRRVGERPLSIAQLRALMQDPPSHDNERAAIIALVEGLQMAGVRLVLAAPQKTGAAAEWDHINRTLRLRTEVLDKGTVEFARVLNHEAIHVAQSCHAGRLRAAPRALGLPRALPPALKQQLLEPLYAGVSAQERRLEEEAYANQHRLALGAGLLNQHCRALR